ncbi:hypothetical protein M405DRAFT_936563 [Rhizopogon salebrosus TDB-379]|nr:hypothetical protein M405DRAFT_936563 [Rhizopogon salebrosus TDB-379]
MANTQLLYLVCRYLQFAMMIIDLSPILQHGFSVKSCTSYFAINSYIGVIVLCCAESLPSLDLGWLQGWRNFQDTMKSRQILMYIIAMLLGPIQKANHIHRYWGEDLYQDALAYAEEIYKEYYQEMHGIGQPKPAEVKTIVGGSRELISLMRELSDDDNDSATSTSTSDPTYDPMKPWLQDFSAHLNSKDHLVAVVAIWAYDFALTFDKEVEFVLGARWRIPKLLYLVCRYLPFAIIAIDLSPILQHGLSVKSCTSYFAINSYIGVTVLCCAETLFMQRVLAMSSYRHWRWIIIFCNLVLFVVPVGVVLTFSNSSSIILQSPIPEITSCYISKTGHVVIVAYIILVIGETKILGLMLYHSWILYRDPERIIPLARILVRHNVFYFTCGLFSSALVVVIMFTTPATYYNVASDVQIVLHTILATRMHRELWRAATYQEASSLGDISVIVFSRPLSEAHD